MAAIGMSWMQAHPSLVLPETILNYQQASGAFEALASGDPMVRLGEGDLYVYMKKLDVRTKVAAGQAAYNMLPSCTIVPAMISTPTYLLRTRAEYDHHDTAALGRWGINIVQAQSLAMRQGIFQQMRSVLLYGMMPQNGEGLLNTNGATTISLPADTNGNTTAGTYDNGQMAQFFLSMVAAVKTRTMQMGGPSRIVILGPQRILSQFEYQGIVQLTSYQRPGGGTTSVKGNLENVMDENGDTLIWCYDDTLQGKGAGGTDAVLLIMPEVRKPTSAGSVTTNEFAKLMPGFDVCSLMLADMAAPREIPTPLAGGAIDVLSEMRVTPGWAVRPECLTIISMAP
jgi:hypothetical protein